MHHVLILGFGYTGAAVAALARKRGQEVLASARRPEDLARLRSLEVEPLPPRELDSWLAEHVLPDTHAVVTFPPDGATDQRIAAALARARAITYVSSTGVYGDLRGSVTDQTPVAPPTERTAPRLAAESIYRSLGATVLRCPGIYGPDRGIHVRLLRGTYRLPGTGKNMVSRIHVEDLAEFVLASAGLRGETFVVGDLEPTTHEQLVSWLCETYRIPQPGNSPLEGVHHTLRADRAIDSSRARELLGVTLKFPTFREGMAPSAIRMPT